MEQHAIITGMKWYGWYSGIDDSSKVHILIKGIKKTELDLGLQG
jgi:hypothetical protein